MQTIDTINPTILLAIELSASTWLVAARVPGLEKPHLHRIDGGDAAALLALISSLQARAARGLDAAIDVDDYDDIVGKPATHGTSLNKIQTASPQSPHEHGLMEW